MSPLEWEEKAQLEAQLKTAQSDANNFREALALIAQQPRCPTCDSMEMAVEALGGGRPEPACSECCRML
jgi:hypothetical protein